MEKTAIPFFVCLLFVGLASSTSSAYFKYTVSACTEAIRFKVAAIRKTIAEQREKDRRPLKPLSEKVEEITQQFTR
ncbi:MAG: hypothetical protein VB050_12965 [Geobacteraceae bacterium]|nr:hypothetical protein [Geobacteraceae bacterium]